MKKFEIKIPRQVKKVIRQLQENGYEAYCVGGCVRDAILEREPADWDVTTNATPQEIKKLFQKTVDTGIKHGTVTVLVDKGAYEVTTYRVDGEYEDARHPKEVTFTKNLREDLLRRDFTINAMAYNEEEGLVDLFGGISDLKGKVIRCVGNAADRLEEDALRILRGIRFGAQLGFEIEKNTKEAMKDMAPNLRFISGERIQVELIKLVVSAHPELLLEAYNLGITKVILPEFDRMMQTTQETPHHMYDVGIHTIKAMEYVKADKVLRLTMLFHDMGKPEYKTIDQDGRAHFKKHGIRSEEITKKVMRRMKFDNDTIYKVSKLVYYHDYRMPAKAPNVRKAINKIGKELFPYYLEVRKADVLAQSDYLRQEKLMNISQIEEVYGEILKKQECTSLRELNLNGKDLIALGVNQGKMIGAVLEELLGIVIEEPKKNDKDILKEEAKRILRESFQIEIK
ncbi:tRNA nucleotidyltransferase (CCA-adding enzyme) [Aequitasia blattaphilus]|uniref:CCA tRNA nucleotidyltransferase n=1 Tax=Aequitasia blattaphilus TaxID=2949332 RepID=A0ABT1EA63_9FIRM|nr:CCA tRNA nucleotidyltransferase [Aequitasia blattaphilus]MCP1102566.1 CCA tRNA nucleotidyltransferase [Aequitasia blattaphilus]MCR8615206.1 CCA tRNA nucleotidyltransferase [Aequitasia blattaphilus]